MPPVSDPSPQQRRSIGRWYTHLLREWAIESRRAILPTDTRPAPQTWSNNELTAAWLGHATVLINLFGLWIVTDPVLFARIGVRLPGLTIGPKRLTAPALRVHELPVVDLVLLSHAHFDHFDMRTLNRLPGSADVVTASRTRDLLRWKTFRSKTELRWGETAEVRRERGTVRVRAFPVKH